MTWRTNGPAALLAPALLLCACNPIESTLGSGWTPTDQLSYRAYAGKATEHDVLSDLPLLLGQHNYLVARQETSLTEFVFETYWRQRAPFADEAALGVTIVETRILVRARRLMDELSLWIEAANRVRDGSGEWRSFKGSEAFREYMDGIANHLRVSLTTGMRTK